MRMGDKPLSEGTGERDMSNLREYRRDGTPVEETASKVRPGPLGRPVAIVLASALILAFVAWAAVELWGETQDTDTPPAATESSEPSPPSTPTPNNGTINTPDNTAPTDRDPTPPSGTGGDSESTSPDGTQNAPAQ
jgi:hypothetical protein